MFYIVECSYNDPPSEAEWNAFYSQEKLPALLSVTGFMTSQRFRAITPGCPVYLALHTVTNADVLHSEEYRLKGGGNFSRWQSCITDWHRNLYACEDPAPALSGDQILLLNTQLVSPAGHRAIDIQAVGLDCSPERRVAWVLPRETAIQASPLPEVYLYEPLTPQLQRSGINTQPEKRSPR
ncbi:sugar ABC transporter [Enterobacter cloacae]|uniref:sugar ABC transporter n=1 Tax=Enterobacter cloacae TaxID=550 RepID=UPI001231E3A6|nr:sugar ABC transporter [Enterobacter cloacae]KAA5945224.1 sugar ABC transporter [Enterobacter cloacae]